MLLTKGIRAQKLGSKIVYYREPTIADRHTTGRDVPHGSAATLFRSHRLSCENVVNHSKNIIGFLCLYVMKDK
jgi:hypothetical protein